MRYVLITVLFFVAHQLTAQSIYHFTYAELVNGSRIPKQALYFENEDGGGFLRVRYTDIGNSEEVLLKYDLTNQALRLANGEEDTSQLIIEAINPEVFIGGNSIVKTTPRFLFKLNKQTSYLEPTALLLSNNVKDIDKLAQFNAKEITAAEATRDFFSNFFNEDDDFMQQYFAENSKNITEAEKNITLHLLVVADTLEGVIGKSCALDYYRIIETYRNITVYLGCKFSVTNAAGKNFSNAGVKKLLSSLKPSKNDIVVFYYTGHGFRKNSDRIRFPYMDLRYKNGQDYLKEAISMHEVYETIKQKNARVNMVLSDCCNSFVQANNISASPPTKKKSLAAAFYMKNVRSLFLNSPVSFMATAADSSQLATSNIRFGGFFSYYFKQALESGCSQGSVAPTWYTILESAKKQTNQKAKRTYCGEPRNEQNICNQEPYYLVR